MSLCLFNSQINPTRRRSAIVRCGVWKDADTPVRGSCRSYPAGFPGRTLGALGADQRKAGCSPRARRPLSLISVQSSERKESVKGARFVRGLRTLDRFFPFRNMDSEGKGPGVSGGVPLAEYEAAPHTRRQARCFPPETVFLTHKFCYRAITIIPFFPPTERRQSRLSKSITSRA